MAESDLKTNSLKIRFAGNCREPTEPEIFDFMRGKMKLKADHLLSMYKDKLDASVIVKFKNEEEFKATLARLPGTMEFAYNKYESTQVRLSPANAVVKYVRLFNLPPEVDDREIGTALSKYGRIQRLIREKYGEETGFPIWTSVRGAYIELKEGTEIPASLHVRNIRARVFYEGLVNKCFLCGATDHIKAECPERKTVNTRLDASRGSYSAAVAGGAARWFKQKMAEPTLSKEPGATMTNLNALFPQTALMKPQQSMVEVKEKAPPAGPSSGKQIAAAKETDDLWSQALAAVADQLQQPQQENKQDGDGWRVVPPKKEKNKKNPKKVRSSSAGSSGASGSVDPKFLRPRTPRPTAISDAQRNRDRSRSAPKNGDSKKPKIIVTAETNEEAKQPSSGEMDVDGVDEMKVAGSGGGQGAGGEQGTGGEQGCGGEVLDDVSL